MKNERKVSRLPDLAVFLNFGIFALCILLVLLGGARVYKNLTVRDRQSYDRRTLCQYLSTRLHQADRENAVCTEDFDGITALCIRETINEKDYITRIYCHNGYLMELFTPANGTFSPSDGETLLPADSLTVSLEENTLRLQLGGESILLYLRSGQGGSHEE